MKKTLFLFALLGILMAGTALGATSTSNSIVSKQPPTISIGSWIKVSGNNQAPWQEAVKAAPKDTLQYRVDVENISKEVQKQVYVQTILGRNLTMQKDIKVDGKAVTYDEKKGIFLGDIAKGQTKVITLTAKKKKNENLVYGQNELIAVFVLDKSHVPVADTATAFVWRQGLAGTTTGTVQASALNTGLTANLGDFIILPFILAIIATLIFRKQLGASFVNFQDANQNAQYFLAQKQLEKMVQNKK